MNCRRARSPKTLKKHTTGPLKNLSRFIVEKNNSYAIIYLRTPYNPMMMISSDLLAFFIGANALIYLVVHLPLDIIMFLSRKQRQRDRKYSPWGGGATMVVTVATTLYFWTFFLCWPVIHLVGGEEFILQYAVDLPVGVQYCGFFLIGAGTFIACIGRIARGRKAVSWGVPEKLTISLGFGIVRHPLYASYCYYFVGIPLAVQSCVLVPLMLGVLGYYTTAKYEETILEKEFGEEYRAYQRTVGMLIPFVGKRKN
jgi:protein-S-isoprenylcysteine O-methyltransferase Ste14